MKQNKIVYTGFEKVNEKDINSSLILLDNIQNAETFLFANDYDIIKMQSHNLVKEDYEAIIMFGQKPRIKNLRLERRAFLHGDTLPTNWNLEALGTTLKSGFIDFKYSDNPGNYYCNYAYFQVMHEIRKQNKKTKVIFIHIPYIDNFIQFTEVTKLINEGKLQKEV